MFEEGLRIGHQHLAEAERRLKQARSLSPNNPWVEYAWGLILLKQFKRHEAFKQFNRIRAELDPSFWPAWQACTWLKLTERNYVAAAEELTAFVGQLVKSVLANGPDEEHVAATHWIGRAIEAVPIVTTRPDAIAALAKGEDHIKQLAAAHTTLQLALEEGRQATRKRYSELVKKTEQTAQRAEKKKQSAAAIRDNRIQDKLKDIQEQLKETAELSQDAEATLEDRLLQIDRELARLDQDFVFLMTQMQLLSEQVQIIGQQLTLQQMTSPAHDTELKQPALNPLLNLYLTQLLAFQREYVNLSQLAQRVAQRANQLLTLRAQLQQRYEQTAAKVQERTAELEKWAERLERVNKARGKAKPTVARKMRGGPATIRVSSISMLLDFKPETEREGVLKALAAKAKRKVARP